MKRTVKTDNAPVARRPGGILTELTDEKLAAAVELNSAERLRLEGRLPWVKFHDDGDAPRVFAGDTWPGNTVAFARFTPETADRRVGEILAPHLQSKVACNWIVGTASQPTDLGQHLRAYGFKWKMALATMKSSGEESKALPMTGVQAFNGRPYHRLGHHDG